jgi:predicted thioesterase
VGIHVDIRHLAPTALGDQVQVTATVQEVDGNKITLTVEAREGEKLVGTGTHCRAVIDVARFLKNVGG